MAVSRALRRLLRIRELEEEQSRLALESALGELNRLEASLAAAVERERRGRRLVKASAQTGELPDRLAGLEETRAADRRVFCSSQKSRTRKKTLRNGARNFL